MNSIESFAPKITTSVPLSTEGEIQAPLLTDGPETLGMLRSLIAGSLQTPGNDSLTPLNTTPDPASWEVPQNESMANPHKDKSENEELLSPEDMALSPSTMETLYAFFGIPSSSGRSASISRELDPAHLPPDLGNFLQSEKNIEILAASLLRQLGQSTASFIPTGSPVSNVHVPSNSSDHLIAPFKNTISTERIFWDLPTAIDCLRGLTTKSSVSGASEMPSHATNDSPQLAEDKVGHSPTEVFSSPPINLGQVILQTLDNQSSPAHASGETQVQVQRLEQVSALMTEMADRVLVTDPLHGQTQEVRIKLAEHIIPDTEIRVWHDEGGQLRIEFETSSGYWARVLNEASPQLAQRLNEKLALPEAATVSVNQQGGQPEDGRSRNRYTPWDLAEATND